MEHSHPRTHRPHRTISRAPAPYDRARDLPRLIPLWPEELADMTQSGRVALVARLAALLRRERQQGLAGAWSYDIARHRQLLIAWRAERDALQAALWKSSLEGTRAAAPARLNPRDAFRAPFFSPALSAPPHSLGRPSGSREAGSTSPDSLPATDYSATGDAASGT
jgi:hypothetical protein